MRWDDQRFVALQDTGRSLARCEVEIARAAALSDCARGVKFLVREHGPMRSAAPEAYDKPLLRVVLCAPRGFCAGVVRAIDTVETALSTFGPPVFVRHEIVHNRFVVEALAARGAVFVDDLERVPDGAAPVVFSAHGVAKSVTQEAERRGLLTIDATCPLVTKVHREAVVHNRRGRHVALIGHAGHPEVIGIVGQLAPNAITLIETLADAQAFVPPDPVQVAYVTQTTLSVDDTACLIGVLRARFPAIVGPQVQDICYATTNRQEAVKRVAPFVDAMIVIGAQNSSNSRRLAEVARLAGCSRVALVPRANAISWDEHTGLTSLGLTAGASAPETLVEEVLDGFAQRYRLALETVSAAAENVHCPVPRGVTPGGGCSTP